MRDIRSQFLLCLFMARRLDNQHWTLEWPDRAAIAERLYSQELKSLRAMIRGADNNLREWALVAA